jgi:hypothetical protein
MPLKTVTPVGFVGAAKSPSTFYAGSAKAQAIIARVERLKLKCKSDQIRDAWASGDRIRALRIAARFYDRSAATKAFKRGMDAHNHPGFYRQLGAEPDEIIANALNVLAQRFGLH